MYLLNITDVWVLCELLTQKKPYMLPLIDTKKIHIRIFMYLDDGTGGAHINQASSHFRAVRRDLAMSGLLVNEEKSNFVPQQQAQVLGLIVDTSSNCITASTEMVGNFPL